MTPIREFIAIHCGNYLMKSLAYQSTEGECSICSAKKHLHHYNEDVICSSCIMLNKPLPRSDKDGQLTVKQLDTIIIIQPSKSFILGRVKAPSCAHVDVLDKSGLGLKDRDFIADFLLNDYIKEEPLLIVWQSKADKLDTFTLSQGDIVQLCGHESRRFDTRKVQQLVDAIGPIDIKRPKLREFAFYLERLSWLIESEEPRKYAEAYKKVAALTKKYPSLSLVQNNFPMRGSDDLELLAWSFKG